jgi:hydroxymethylpyrimidine/phosphomethylpyrimidine kinase
MIPNVLSIAGSDPSGGAGILADVKTFSALGAYGAAVITALTAQNTRQVTGVQPVPAEFVALQIDTLFLDLEFDALKLGMLANADISACVADRLRYHGAKNVVVDPVMIAKSGDCLLDMEAIDTLRTRVLPLAEIITPNLPEAGVLLGRPAPSTLDGMRDTAVALWALGPRYVLLKGGHLESSESTDILFDGHELLEFSAPRVATANTHGTGCTLSAAIAALIPRRPDMASVVRDAKAYVTAAILASGALQVGKGHGPLHHFHRLWPADTTPSR